MTKEALWSNGQGEKTQSIAGSSISCIIFFWCLKKRKSLSSKLQLLLPERLVYSCHPFRQEDRVGFFLLLRRKTSTMGEELLLITIRGFLWKLAPMDWSENQSISRFLSQVPQPHLCSWGCTAGCLITGMWQVPDMASPSSEASVALSGARSSCCYCRQSWMNLIISW